MYKGGFNSTPFRMLEEGERKKERKKEKKTPLRGDRQKPDQTRAPSPLRGTGPSGKESSASGNELSRSRGSSGPE